MIQLIFCLTLLLMIFILVAKTFGIILGNAYYYLLNPSKISKFINDFKDEIIIRMK
ncbi:MAG: hypothetical protein RR620_08680 [Clostridium sp.]